MVVTDLLSRTLMRRALSPCPGVRVVAQVIEP